MTRFVAAFVTANLLLSLMVFSAYQWSFQSSFKNYVDESQKQTLLPLQQGLEQHYAMFKNWDWFTQRSQNWTLFMRSKGQVSNKSISDADDKKSRKASGAGQAMLSTIDSRLLLLDAQQQVVAGKKRKKSQYISRPLFYQQQIVGYLAYRPRTGLLNTLDNIFVDQHAKTIRYITAAMVAMGLLMAIAFAAWLARPVRRLAQATSAISNGDYSYRLVDLKGSDELSLLTQNFNAMASQLEAAATSRRQWVADIAHELRTPLAILVGEMEALEDGYETFNSDSLGSLQAEAKRLRRLVDDLHQLSLADLGALAQQKQALPLAALLELVTESFSHELRQHDLALELVLDDEVEVWADSDKLHQLVQNLLQNSLRYTDGPGHLRVTLSKQGSFALLNWEDSAPGVIDENLEQLTERLFRVDHSRNPFGGGSGLGLAIVSAIVDAHQGQMQALHSDLGGLQWHILLPLKR